MGTVVVVASCDNITESFILQHTYYFSGLDLNHLTFVSCIDAHFFTLTHMITYIENPFAYILLQNIA